jgi:hypothetical protein
MYSSDDQSTSRSPGSHRNQNQTGTLHRMPSRNFDGYSQGNMYTPDENIRSFEQPRNFERLNATIHAGGYGYDVGASSGWNTTAFSQNGLATLGGAAARMKSQQRGGGRSALPAVRKHIHCSPSAFRLTYSAIGMDGAPATAPSGSSYLRPT